MRGKKGVVVGSNNDTGNDALNTTSTATVAVAVARPPTKNERQQNSQITSSGRSRSPTVASVTSSSGARDQKRDQMQKLDEKRLRAVFRLTMQKLWNGSIGGGAGGGGQWNAMIRGGPSITHENDSSVAGDDNDAAAADNDDDDDANGGNPGVVSQSAMMTSQSHTGATYKLNTDDDFVVLQTLGTVWGEALGNRITENSQKYQYHESKSRDDDKKVEAKADKDETLASATTATASSSSSSSSASTRTKTSLSTSSKRSRDEQEKEGEEAEQTDRQQAEAEPCGGNNNALSSSSSSAAAAAATAPFRFSLAPPVGSLASADSRSSDDTHHNNKESKERADIYDAVRGLMREVVASSPKSTASSNKAQTSSIIINQALSHDRRRLSLHDPRLVTLCQRLMKLEKEKEKEGQVKQTIHNSSQPGQLTPTQQVGVVETVGVGARRDVVDEQEKEGADGAGADDTTVYANDDGVNSLEGWLEATSPIVSTSSTVAETHDDGVGEPRKKQFGNTLVMHTMLLPEFDEKEDRCLLWPSSSSSNEEKADAAVAGGVTTRHNEPASAATKRRLTMSLEHSLTRSKFLNILESLAGKEEPVYVGDDDNDSSAVAAADSHGQLQSHGSAMNINPSRHNSANSTQQRALPNKCVRSSAVLTFELPESNPSAVTSNSASSSSTVAATAEHHHHHHQKLDTPTGGTPHSHSSHQRVLELVCSQVQIIPQGQGEGVKRESGSPPTYRYLSRRNIRRRKLTTE